MSESSDQDRLGIGTLDETATSVDMQQLTGSMGLLNVNENGHLARRVSILENQMREVVNVLEIVKNDDGSSTSVVLDFLQKKTLDLGLDVSRSITMADNNLSTACGGLLTSIDQVKESIRNMRAKVDEQLVLKQTLVDLVEKSQQQQQTSSENLQLEMEFLNKYNNTSSQCQVPCLPAQQSSLFQQTPFQQPL